MLSPDDPELMALAAKAVAAQKLYDDDDSSYGGLTKVSKVRKSSSSSGGSDGSSSSRGGSGTDSGPDEAGDQADVLTFEGTVLESSKGHLSVALDRSVSDIMSAISEKHGERGPEEVGGVGSRGGLWVWVLLIVRAC